MAVIELYMYHTGVMSVYCRTVILAYHESMMYSGRYHIREIHVSKHVIRKIGSDHCVWKTNELFSEL